MTAVATTPPQSRRERRQERKHPDPTTVPPAPPGPAAKTKHRKVGIEAKTTLAQHALRVVVFGIVPLACVVYIARTVTGISVAGGHGAAVPTVASSPVGPSGHAVEFVAAYVSAGEGTETTLSPFLGAPVQLTGVKPGSFRVTGVPVVRDAHEVCAVAGCGYWSVLVQAGVVGVPPSALSTPAVYGAVPTTVATSAYLPLGARCWLVDVQTNAGRYVSTELPKPWPCPVPATAVAPIFGSPSLPDMSDAVTAMVSQFVSALLAGTPDLRPYLAPQAPISPITPPPFASVTLTGVAKGGVHTNAAGIPEELVLVGVSAKDDAGRVEQMSYPLRLVRPLANGQWLVAQVYGAPPLSKS